jgi:hypothetical protein
MVKVDVADEFVVDASPKMVYKAILDMYAGVSSPWVSSTKVLKLRGGGSVCEGAICDITVRAKGVTTKTSDKMTKIVEGKLIEYEETGDFVGSGKFTFEPTDGKTKMQLQRNVRTNRLLFSFLAHFINLKKTHSDMAQQEIKALNSYLSQK